MAVITIVIVFFRGDPRWDELADPCRKVRRESDAAGRLCTMARRIYSRSNPKWMCPVLLEKHWSPSVHTYVRTPLLQRLTPHYIGYLTPAT